MSDLRYALRSLRKAPGFTAVAILILALGTGANATIYTWMKAMLLQPLPGVERQDELLAVGTRTRAGQFISFSYPNYVDLRDRNDVLAGLIAYDDVVMNVRDGNRTERAFGGIVTGNFFDVLGVKAALGRTFGPEHDRTPGTDPVVVLSHRYWEHRFHRDQAIVGKTIFINDHPFTVMGVTAAPFQGTLVAVQTGLWVPMMMERRVRPGGSRLQARGHGWLQVMARAKPGITRDRANLALATLSTQLAEAHHENDGLAFVLFRLWQAPFGTQKVLGPILFVLAGVVALVLLIACANVANLLLSRAAGRRREMAVRLSLGASRGRLVRQLLTESVLLGLLGGAGGIVVAYWSAGLFMAFAPPTDTPINVALDLDLQVLAFTSIVALATGIVFGLMPALQGSKPDLVPALKEDTGRTSPGRGRAALRNTLVVTQVAISVVLLIVAGLFLQSVRHAQRMNPGFDPDHVVTAAFDLFSAGYTSEQGRRFIEQLLPKIETLPGVQAATVARRIPLALGGRNSTSVEVEGYQPAKNEEMGVAFNIVGPKYFETMRTPVVAGRDFAPSDRIAAPLVMVVNETMARRYWPKRDPIGRRVRVGEDWWRVVGVARDIKTAFINEDPEPYFYLPVLQNYTATSALHVRSREDAGPALTAIREVVRQMDPKLPLFETRPLAEHMRAGSIVQRMGASLLGLFGGLALLLAAVGLYSVIAYSVSQRTYEIGIRMALGAEPGQLRRMVVRQGMRVTVVGVVVGLLAAFAGTRFLVTLLYGVSPNDFITFASVSLVLALVALVATFVPARRASRLDPVVALRAH
jgi:predicted permease